MKPLHIEFVPDRRWLAIWIPALLISLGVGGVAAWQWQEARSTARQTAERLASTQRELAQIRATTAAPQDLRWTHAARAAKLLQHDMNAPFAVLENFNEPQSRLRHLQLDMESGAIRLEYELDSMARASTVTTALNAGYERPPWQLENLSVVQGGGGTAPSGQSVRGLWTSQLDRLK